jgi:hypothetical protein
MNVVRAQGMPSSYALGMHFVGDGMMQRLWKMGSSWWEKGTKRGGWGEMS